MLGGLRPQMTGYAKKLRPYDQPPKRRRSLIPAAPDSAATWFFVFGALWFLAASGLAMLWAAQLLFPQLRAGFQLPVVNQPFEISPITVQAAFINALVYGWLTNAGFAVALFLAPRLTGERIPGEGIAFLGALVWNLALAAGLLTVFLPKIAGSGSLATFPLPVDGLALLGIFIVNAAFWRTLIAARAQFSGGDRPYVSLLFAGVGLLALLGLYALASAAPIVLSGTNLALVDAFTARGISTYWLLGITFATLFYVVPRATGNPLASGGLALLALVTWLVLAGGSALGALLDPTVPYFITTAGNVATILLVLPVFLVIGNLVFTLSGRWSLMLTPGTLTFALVSLAFLLAGAVLDAVGSLRSVQASVTPTEWTAGAWLFAAYGAFTFAGYAAADHALPRVLRRAWRETPMASVRLWTTFAGVTIGGLGLMAAGLAHASLAGQGLSGDQLAAQLFGYRAAAALGIALAALGPLTLLVELFLMYTSGRPVEAVTVSPAADDPITVSSGNSPGPISAPSATMGGR
ncbi:MAG: hypothetical protein DLM71_03930 [Chloroflexi bacterium]|nr:MAG: hypothetical protein DLM71_03930 [Chloroflexota bacterium]